MVNNAFWLVLQKLRTPLFVIILTYSIAILGMVLIPGMDDKGNVYHLTFFDAFYFVSYMASTIGFGESPYDFTYAQKLWVSFCIYLTVIGWFYGIGALVNALTDKMLKHEFMRNRFRKRVNSIKDDFVIILGYNSINAEIIKKMHASGKECVLIDIDEEKINHFLLEDFSRDIPVMVGDALLTDTLILAGIQDENCKGVVALFSSEEKNLRISVLTCFLNKNIQVIAKSTKKEITSSILDTDIATIINPFDIFAKRLDIALTAPHLLIIENWIYGNSDLSTEIYKLPKGKYIVCGYGRFGKALESVFIKNKIEHVFVDEKRITPHKTIEDKRFISANPDDRNTLIEAGIEEASCLIIGTKNDIVNISIMITAKKINPNIYLIVRENTMDEVSIFNAADIHWLFIIERILVNKSALFLNKTFKNYFLQKLLNENEIFAKEFVRLLQQKIGNNPKLKYLSITEKSSYAIYHEIKAGRRVTIDIFSRSLSNWEKSTNIIPVFLKGKNRESILPKGIDLEIGDEILFACEYELIDDIESIASNIYELYYVLTGKEKQIGILGKLFKGKH